MLGRRAGCPGTSRGERRVAADLGEFWQQPHHCGRGCAIPNSCAHACPPGACGKTVDAGRQRASFSSGCRGRCADSAPQRSHGQEATAAHSASAPLQTRSPSLRRAFLQPARRAPRGPARTPGGTGGRAPRRVGRGPRRCGGRGGAASCGAPPAREGPARGAGGRARRCARGFSSARAVRGRKAGGRAGARARRAGGRRC